MSPTKAEQQDSISRIKLKKKIVDPYLRTLRKRVRFAIKASIVSTVP